MLGYRKRLILGFIKEYKDENNYPPTVREIGDEVGLSSSSTVHRHLTDLKDKGYITFEEGKPRTIQLIKSELM